MLFGAGRQGGGGDGRGKDEAGADRRAGQGAEGGAHAHLHPLRRLRRRRWAAGSTVLPGVKSCRSCGSVQEPGLQLRRRHPARVEPSKPAVAVPRQQVVQGVAQEHRHQQERRESNRHGSPRCHATRRAAVEGASRSDPLHEHQRASVWPDPCLYLAGLGTGSSSGARIKASRAMADPRRPARLRRWRRSTEPASRRHPAFGRRGACGLCGPVVAWRSPRAPRGR